MLGAQLKIALRTVILVCRDNPVNYSLLGCRFGASGIIALTVPSFLGPPLVSSLARPDNKAGADAEGPADCPLLLTADTYQVTGGSEVPAAIHKGGTRQSRRP